MSSFTMGAKLVTFFCLSNYRPCLTINLRCGGRLPPLLQKADDISAGTDKDMTLLSNGFHFRKLDPAAGARRASSDDAATAGAAQEEVPTKVVIA